MAMMICALVVSLLLDARPGVLLGSCGGGLLVMLAGLAAVTNTLVCPQCGNKHWLVGEESRRTPRTCPKCDTPWFDPPR